MQITEVKVFPVSEEKLKAFVSVVFDGCFMVNDIKIIRGRDGLFISMPSRKKKNGEFKDVAHPLNNETRQTIEGQVLAEYERVLAELEEREATDGPLPRSSGALRMRRPKPEHSEVPRPRPAPVPAAAAADDAAAGVDLPPARPRPVPAPSRPEAAAMAVASDADEAPKVETDTTLEEVEELHLRDSFWTVT